MIIFSILGYLIIVGIIMADRGHELDYVLRTLETRLGKYGIETEITIHKDRTVTISACKRNGIMIQHCSVHSSGLLDALWKLIQYIENEIEAWITKELY